MRRNYISIVRIFQFQIKILKKNFELAKISNFPPCQVSLYEITYLQSGSKMYALGAKEVAPMTRLFSSNAGASFVL